VGSLNRERPLVPQSRPDAASSPPDLVERLREIAVNPRTANRRLDYWFSPEQVAAGLEAAIQAAMWCAITHGHGPDRERAITAFLAAAGANPKEGT